jgi:hypothetical protein
VSEEKKLNIFQKLVEVRKCVSYLEKSAEGFKYKYVPGADVLTPVVAKMNELGLLLIPEVYDPKITIERIDNVDNRIIETKMNMKWINSEKPEEFLVVPWLLFGEQNDISKAFGSGLTYSERYFLLKFFNIPTNKDDPDTRQTKLEKKEVRAESKKNIKSFNEKLEKSEKFTNEIKNILLKHFPGKDTINETAKKKLLQFAFNSTWNEIVSFDPEILETGLQKIINVLSNETNLKILKGEEQGAIFDPTVEPIAEPEKEPIKDDGATDWQANLKEIIAFKEKKRVPEADYYAILAETIKGTEYKHANEIAKIVSQKQIISALQKRADYYTKKTESQ